MKKILLLASIALFAVSCNVATQQKSSEGNANVVAADENTKAVLYMQTAAEYRALCYQTFNYGKLMLDNYLRRMNMSEKYAIVVDIDETILDNSPHAAQSILDGTKYPVGWKEWINLAEAQPIPGALEFLNYASQKGVDIFYVSNRKEMYREATLKNLTDTGFPNVEDKFVLLRTETSGKEIRRNKVEETHQIILLFGDNLNDFLEVFEGKTVQERFQLTDKFKADFGSRFLVLPNPAYGEWEGAIINYDYSLSQEKQYEMKAGAFKGYK